MNTLQDFGEDTGGSEPFSARDSERTKVERWPRPSSR